MNTQQHLYKYNVLAFIILLLIKWERHISRVANANRQDQRQKLPLLWQNYVTEDKRSASNVEDDTRS